MVQCYGPTILVFSIYDSTEVAIQKMIEASQRLITIGGSNEERKGVPLRGMNRTLNWRNIYFLARVAFKKVRVDIQDTILKQAALTRSRRESDSS